MNLTFVNGTNVQRQGVLRVAHGLLNLPFDAIPLNLTVEFVADPNPEVHNEFASTSITYGSSTAAVKISNKAPNWGQPFRGIQFLQEVFAHELGHAVFAALPEASRDAIAQMFGAKSADLAEINPPGSKWENRYLEGIAETFKDAFLPRRLRLYANRTNRRIAISRYPEFRALVREGVAGVGVGVDFGPIDIFNNPFGQDLEAGWPRRWAPFGFGGTAEIDDGGEPLRADFPSFFRAHFGGKYGLNNPAFFPPRFSFKTTEDHSRGYGLAVPAMWFPTDRTWEPHPDTPRSYGLLLVWRFLASVGAELVADFRAAWSVGVPLSNAREWLRREKVSSEDWAASNFWGLNEGTVFGGEPAGTASWGSGTMNLWRDAIAPPMEIKHGFSSSAGDQIVVYGRATAAVYWDVEDYNGFWESWETHGIPFTPPPNPFAGIGPELPELIFQEGGASGKVVEIPSGLITPTGSRGGMRRVGHMVSGGRR
jgi:hypothetical protein